MSIPERLDLEAYAGDTFHRRLSFYTLIDPDAADTEDNRQAKNITSWTNITAQVRSGSTLIASISTNVTDAGQGRVDISISSEDTKDIAPGHYAWDMQRQDDDDPQTIRTVVKGDFEVQGDVTQIQA